MEIIFTLLQTQPWFAIVPAIISLASAIAAATPTPKAGTLASKIYRFVDIIAINVGKAKDTGSSKAGKTIKPTVNK
tara:strand:+ start:502 stop:729 length:228 start_codon:yes stop_codon:yes gene_type:complete